MQPDQPRKLVTDPGAIRELQVLHARINDLIANPAVPAAATNATTTHTAADVATAADIAAIINTHAATLNAIGAAVNQVLSKINLG